ncbi:hypothetical protein IIA16_01605 [bacterium]|nr:hypothetical protein [bacterium]
MAYIGYWDLLEMLSWVLWAVVVVLGLLWVLDTMRGTVRLERRLHKGWRESSAGGEVGRGVATPMRLALWVGLGTSFAGFLWERLIWDFRFPMGELFPRPLVVFLPALLLFAAYLGWRWPTVSSGGSTYPASGLWAWRLAFGHVVVALLTGVLAAMPPRDPWLPQLLESVLWRLLFWGWLGAFLYAGAAKVGAMVRAISGGRPVSDREARGQEAEHQ